jgi:hypothetical protein
VTAHIGATYLSEGWLYLAIEYHHASQRLVHTTDIGVSYFLVGVIAVLAYRNATPSAIFIGLMFYPMTRRRSATGGSRSRS